MPLNIRAALRELLGTAQVSDEQLRQELDELKIDTKLEELTRGGHVGADPLVQQLARAALKGEATPAQLEQLLTAPRPVPATTAVITPQAGPTTQSDPVEAAIQAEMQRSGSPYHVAAGVVATGGTLTPASGGKP